MLAAQQQTPTMKVLLVILLLQSASAFSVRAKDSTHGRFRTTTTTLAASTATATDELLSPQYEIEPIQTRIGHGFDIHRMAPLQDAGQPVVIGGVEITHKDQKVGSKLRQIDLHEE